MNLSPEREFTRRMGRACRDHRNSLELRRKEARPCGVRYGVWPSESENNEDFRELIRGVAMAVGWLIVSAILVLIAAIIVSALF